MRAHDIATTVSRQNGMPITTSGFMEGMVPSRLMGYYGELASATLPSQTRENGMGGQTSVTNSPVGVVAAITPWNYPQPQAAFKYSAALAPVVPSC